MSNHKILVTSGKKTAKWPNKTGIICILSLWNWNQYKNTKEVSTWHLVLPAVCDKGLFSVSLSHFQSWGVAVMSNLQLLGLFNCLPAPFLSPLITAHPFHWFSPPPVSVDGATPRQGITHNLDSHTTLSQGWRTRHYQRHLFPHPRRYDLG